MEEYEREIQEVKKKVKRKNKGNAPKSGRDRNAKKKIKEGRHDNKREQGRTKVTREKKRKYDKN